MRVQGSGIPGLKKGLGFYSNKIGLLLGFFFTYGVTYSK